MFLILKVCPILLLTPFSACDVRGRRRAGTSRICDVSGGDPVSGFLTSSGSPLGGGVPVPFVPLGVSGDAKHGSLPETQQ